MSTLEVPIPDLSSPTCNLQVHFSSLFRLIKRQVPTVSTLARCLRNTRVHQVIDGVLHATFVQLASVLGTPNDTRAVYSRGSPARALSCRLQCLTSTVAPYGRVKFYTETTVILGNLRQHILIAGSVDRFKKNGHQLLTLPSAAVSRH